MAAKQGFIDWNAIHNMCGGLAANIEIAGWEIDIVVGLQNGGAHVAAFIAELLGNLPFVVLDVVEDDRGICSLGGVVKLQRNIVAGRHVLSVNDVTTTGELLEDVDQEVRKLGGVSYSAALVGVGDYPKRNNLIVTCRLPTVPTFAWQL